MLLWEGLRKRVASQSLYFHCSWETLNVVVYCYISTAKQAIEFCVFFLLFSVCSGLSGFRTLFRSLHDHTENEIYFSQNRQNRKGQRKHSSHPLHTIPRLCFGIWLICMYDKMQKNNLPSKKKKKTATEPAWPFNTLFYHFIVLVLNGHHTTSHQKLLENDFHHRTLCTRLILQSIGLGNTHQDHKQFNEFQMERSTHAKWKRGDLIADRGNGRVSCNYAPAKHFLTTDQILLDD